MSRETRASIAKATSRLTIAAGAAFANNRTAMAGFLAARSQFWRGRFPDDALTQFNEALRLERSRGRARCWRAL
jgi:hypothetical protein